jgi:hypothetical protein
VLAVGKERAWGRGHRAKGKETLDLFIHTHHKQVI